MPDPRLSPFSRTFLTLAIVLIGVVPSLVFFFWIERNMSLPILPVTLSFPWAHLEEMALPLKLVFDSALVLAFGAIHTALAQENIQKCYFSWIKPPAMRAFFMMVTGVSSFLMIAFWQNTGILIWNLPLPQPLGNMLSILLFWLILAVTLVIMSSHRALHFLGFEQLSKNHAESVESSTLIRSGFYRYVRHPIYTVTFLAVLAAPMMSLDRALFLVMNGVYMIFAIPIEEKKLIRIFGQAYAEYRKQVPALIPFTRF